MVDVLTKKQRSYNMSMIRGRNTKPEIKLRKLLFSKGLRGYRLSGLPGKPDMIFLKYKVAIFVDGCFWHKCPEHFKEPATRKRFWTKKIDGNVKRDNEINRILKEEGWTVLRFWEHEIEKNINNCYLSVLNELVKKGYRNGNKNT
ncbi:MAG: very short patch repair endonuclease [Candidatus Methanoperedens sp.]|nr:very short patch repair endonuclease [Candidatus Methanoperedens sp.]